jgi:TetR/AcrR family transcriptional regulator, transcriptional repressor for nem operon
MPKTATDTKSRILKAGRSLFSSHGCDGTTLDDIITASGITKGAFYHYFKTKDLLCQEVLDEVINDYHKLVEYIATDIEPIEQLRSIIHKIVELNASGHWVNCRLMLRFTSDSHESNPVVQRKVRQFWQWYTNFYEDLIIRCRDGGQLGTQMEAKTLAKLLISTMAGAVVLDKTAPDDSQSHCLAEAVINILLA